MSTQTDGSGYPGQLGISVPNSKYNAQRFHIKQMLARMQTVTLVQVIAVNPGANGGTFPLGTVDVQPLVNLMDGLGNTTPQGVIYGLPYFRLQGGLNAIVCDPVVGDMGMAAFASRDISLVIKNGGQSPPGSRRRNSRSDGLYLGGFLNSGSPTQTVAFKTTGIEIDDKNGNTIKMTAAGIIINGVTFDRSQNVTGANDVSLTNAVTLKTHVHTGVTTGSGNTGLPTG